MDAPTEEKEKKSTVAIKVVDQNGNETYFKLKPTTKLGRVMKVYCERASVQESSIRFLFDGERLNPDSTPADYDMEEDDIIDAVLQQTGGQPAPNWLMQLAQTKNCYFCIGKLNAATLFPFSAARPLGGCVPIFGACRPCAIRNVDKFVAGEGLARLAV